MVKIGPAATLVAAACLAIACGGGGSSGGGGTTSSRGCLELLPAREPAPSTVVMQQGSDSTCDRVAIDLIVTDVNDVNGGQFIVEYRDDIALFDGLNTAGSFLAADGPVAAIPTERVGEVEVAINLLGGGTASAVGPQRLVRLYFTREDSSGSTSLALSNERLVDGTPMTIDDVFWYSGSLAIR